MKIAVTGSSGRIGKYVVRDLVGARHDVLGIDVDPPAEFIGSAMQVDLTDASQVYGAFGRFKPDAVIHVGAWANAGVVVDTKTYGDNVRGTFNVFQACADIGTQRVISASSAQVYAFSSHAPNFVRADETHPLRPVNCYALSKVTGENAAEYFTRHYGMTILSFRFQGVRAPSELDEQIARMSRNPGSGRGQLWTRTDARDAAEACRLAVEAEDVETGPYNIGGARIVLDVPVAELLRRHYNAEVEIREGQDEWSAPMSSERAQEAFGYEPKYVWTINDRHPE